MTRHRVAKLGRFACHLYYRADALGGYHSKSVSDLHAFEDEWKHKQVESILPECGVVVHDFANWRALLVKDGCKRSGTLNIPHPSVSPKAPTPPRASNV